MPTVKITRFGYAIWMKGEKAFLRDWKPGVPTYYCPILIFSNRLAAQKHAVELYKIGTTYKQAVDAKFCEVREIALELLGNSVWE